MTISRIESLVYGIEDMDAGIRYFEDWGLECLERGADGAHFATPAGQSVVLKMATDASLPDAIERGSTLREVIWGVDDAADLRRIGAELARDREVKKGANGTLHTLDDAAWTAPVENQPPVQTRFGLFLVVVSHLNNHVGQMSYLVQAQGHSTDEPPVW